MTQKITILDTVIHDCSESDLYQEIDGFLRQTKLKLLFTPNPEICLHARQNKKFQDVLNQGDMNIPDGFGLKIGAFLSGQQIQHRHTGSDLTKYLLQLAHDRRLTIFIINHPDSLSSLIEIKKSVLNDYPNLKLHGYKSADITNDLLDHINNTKPDIIFTTHGAPIQESLLHQLRDLNITAKLGLGVGGSFDFITGRQTRAPEIMRRLGLEWLFRLYKQPKRINRIFKAVIVFPLICLKHSLAHKDRKPS
ncbi:TPA: hypothetical protein DF272_03600 [Candidatus Falkowbacteria bacterium]|nr:hypothetical protein [Candidatus Falkowbacteria bacterium]